MKQDELKNQLRSLMDDKQSYFNLRKCQEEHEAGLYIEANRNGILAFCSLLLSSIEKEKFYQIPDEFNEGSDISIDYVQIEEGNKNFDNDGKENIVQQIGCFAASIALALIFIAGLITTFNWLTKLLG